MVRVFKSTELTVRLLPAPTTRLPVPSMAPSMVNVPVPVVVSVSKLFRMIVEETDSLSRRALRRGFDRHILGRVELRHERNTRRGWQRRNQIDRLRSCGQIERDRFCARHGIGVQNGLT